MNLTWYAETSARRTRQMLTDVLALAGLLVCFWIGSTVHDATEELAGPGRSIESAGNDLAERLDEASNAADDIPAVGDELAAPLDRARDVGEQIESAGARQQEVVATLADVLGLTLGGVPALWLLLRWLPPRVRFARRAHEATLLRQSSAGIDLLALRALARQPLRELMRLRQSPITGWRERDPQVVAALASLELRRLGVRGIPPGQA